MRFSLRSFGGVAAASGRRALLSTVLGFWAVAALGCATAEPNPRSLHYMDGELVHSRPPHARAYEAYLRARLALESRPPRLEEALRYIDIATRYEPREPQIWTTRAEIEAEAGEVDRALASAAKALELRPGYSPAQRLIASLDGHGPAATAATSSGSAAARP